MFWKKYFLKNAYRGAYCSGNELVNKFVLENEITMACIVAE